MPKQINTIQDLDAVHTEHILHVINPPAIVRLIAEEKRSNAQLQEIIAKIQEIDQKREDLMNREDRERTRLLEREHTRLVEEHTRLVEEHKLLHRKHYNVLEQLDRECAHVVPRLQEYLATNHITINRINNIQRYSDLQDGVINQLEERMKTLNEESQQAQMQKTKEKNEIAKNSNADVMEGMIKFAKFANKLPGHEKTKLHASFMTQLTSLSGKNGEHTVIDAKTALNKFAKNRGFTYAALSTAGLTGVISFMTALLWKTSSTAESMQKAIDTAKTAWENAQKAVPIAKADVDAAVVRVNELQKLADAKRLVNDLKDADKKFTDAKTLVANKDKDPAPSADDIRAANKTIDDMQAAHDKFTEAKTLVANKGEVETTNVDANLSNARGALKDANKAYDNATKHVGNTKQALDDANSGLVSINEKSADQLANGGGAAVSEHNPKEGFENVFASDNNVSIIAGVVGTCLASALAAFFLEKIWEKRDDNTVVQELVGEVTTDVLKMVEGKHVNETKLAEKLEKLSVLTKSGNLLSQYAELRSASMLSKVSGSAMGYSKLEAEEIKGLPSLLRAFANATQGNNSHSPAPLSVLHTVKAAGKTLDNKKTSPSKSTERFIPQQFEYPQPLKGRAASHS